LPRDFIAGAPDGVVAGSETLDGMARAEEVVMLGLRLRIGIDLAGFEWRYGVGLVGASGAQVQGLVEAGMVEIDHGKLRISDDSVFVSNEVLCRLLMPV
jgi:coproporphyrinogen III oxidase-like Fe-S oxidoreductase